MQIITTADVFVAHSSFTEKEIVKNAGFLWHGYECKKNCPACKKGLEHKVWWTDDAEKAAKLIDYADFPTKERLESIAKELSETQIASRAVDLDIEIPVPDGLSYMPFQKAGIAFASSRPSTLIGDEPGLGKTIQALGVINLDSSIRKVLIVCPASLRLNWKRESEKWLIERKTVAIASTAGVPAADIVIVNWDILAKLSTKLEGTTFDLLIADEAHFAKNGKAKRSKALYSLNAKRKIFLTGTAIVNRPIEIFPLINSLDPKRWPSFFCFAKRYANAYHNGFGWDFSGAAHLDELQDKLRSTILIRRLKADVLTELPAKRRQIIELSPSGAAGLIERERQIEARREETMTRLHAQLELAKASDDPTAYDEAVDNLTNGARLAFEEIARVRHDTAVAKIPAIVAHIKDLIEDGDYSVVCMCHHHDVQDALVEELGSVAVLHRGGMNDADKQESVDRFQNDPTVQVFIGSILASGVGITLTRSSHVVFAELDWVPGNVTQAEDRVHRIGQTDSVLVQHLVLEGSIDSRMAKTLIAKQSVIDAALDTRLEDREVQIEIEPRKQRASSADTTREMIAAEALLITDDQIAAIHSILCILAGLDQDHAAGKNDIGFNKIDSKIGHDLAGRRTLTPKQAALGRRIAKKYHRQIPVDLMEASGAN